MNKLDSNILDVLKNAKEDENKNEALNEAASSLGFASNIMESIMAGKQIDLAFYSLYSKHCIKKIKGSK
jgi:hypothetical protein